MEGRRVSSGTHMTTRPFASDFIAAVRWTHPTPVRKPISQPASSQRIRATVGCYRVITGPLLLLLSGLLVDSRRATRHTCESLGLSYSHGHLLIELSVGHGCRLLFLLLHHRQIITRGRLCLLLSKQVYVLQTSLSLGRNQL